MGYTEYNMSIMQGARLYRKFTINDEDFKFSDYNIKMEIRNNEKDERVLFLNDTQIIITDTTLEIDIGASITKNFPVTLLNYGIELIDKNDSENVIPYLIGNIEVISEIPRDEEDSNDQS